MIVEQIYTGCLAQGAYYIESNGEAAVIDPLREVGPYLQRAEKNNATIKYIFETHFHADFVSGHLTLSNKTNAPIVFGPLADPDFDVIIAKDGQSFSIGDVTITALHTPGHTMESTTYLLRDAKGKDRAIFSGDTLFLGDVGRPDLAQKKGAMTQEQLAETLYDSLRNQIMPLADDITVYPAHGAGSACGKKMMKETVDTLGNQKKVNYALREDMTKEEFVNEVIDGLLPPPQYFPENVRLNKNGYEDIDQVIEKGKIPLSPSKFEYIAMQSGAVILDVRSADEFSKGHIPNSIFIGIDGAFAPWVGTLIGDTQHPIILVTPEGREEETITRLSRVGFDNTLGYLEGGITAWTGAGKDIEQIENITATQLQTKIEKGAALFDVRKESEYDSVHIPNATLIPLDKINESLNHYDFEKEFYLHCAGGYRSMIALSILKKRGIHGGFNVAGGMKAIKETSIDLQEMSCSN
ncbi:MAG: rhodanese-like domain-containing protein [Bacteroidota bacterium]|nr:rhodanese-like domain-containing protein [Bacteroidota bacterium]